MPACPTADAFLRLLDGQLSVEHAGELRSHAADCRACQRQLERSEALGQRLGAPIGATSSEVKAQLLARIAQVPQASTEPVEARRWLPIGFGVALMAGTLVLLPRLRHPEASGFTARGAGTPASVARDVGVEHWRDRGGTLVGVDTEGILLAGEPIFTTYTNLGKTPAFLLSVAIDANGKAHWIQPGEASTAPLELPPTRNQKVALPESVVLDSPAPGPLRLITLVTPTPVAPSTLAPLLGARPSSASLSARFPNASVNELTLTVVP